jgi:hypothetical protein
MANWRVLFSEPNGVEHVAEIAAVGAKSVHQGYQVGAILIGYGRKFQAQAAVGKLMLHDSFGTNLSLGN